MVEAVVSNYCDVTEIGKYVVADRVRRCVGVSTFAAVSLVPYVTGIGVAVAVDLPVNVEVCQYVTGNIEYSFDGIGLSWSSPGVREACERAAYKYLLEGVVFVYDITSYIETVMGGVGVETALASLLGKSVVIVGVSNIPIHKFNGAWFVVMKPLENSTSNKFEVDEKLLNMFDRIGKKFISEPLAALLEHSEKIPKVVGADEHILSVVEQKGINAIATVSGYGSYYVGLSFNESDAKLLANYWRKYGPTIYSRVLV